MVPYQKVVASNISYRFATFPTGRFITNLGLIFVVLAVVSVHSDNIVLMK